MKIQENISLKNYNTFGVEAKAHYFAEVHDLHELKRNALAVGAVVPFCRCVFLYRGTPSFPRCRGPPDQSEFLAIQADRR